MRSPPSVLTNLRTCVHLRSGSGARPGRTEPCPSDSGGSISPRPAFGVLQQRAVSVPILRPTIIRAAPTLPLPGPAQRLVRATDRPRAVV